MSVLHASCCCCRVVVVTGTQARFLLAAGRRRAEGGGRISAEILLGVSHQITQTTFWMHKTIKIPQVLQRLPKQSLLLWDFFALWWLAPLACLLVHKQEASKADTHTNTITLLGRRRLLRSHAPTLHTSSQRKCDRGFGLEMDAFGLRTAHEISTDLRTARCTLAANRKHKNSHFNIKNPLRGSQSQASTLAEQMCFVCI